MSMRMTRNIFRYSAIIFLLLTLFSTAYGQQFVARGPSEVGVGEQFRVTFTINTQNVSGFKAPAFPDELEVLMGPRTSSQSSYQIINGKTSSSSSITYTYILMADKKGKYSIPAAHITADGKSVSSNPIQIYVNASASSNGGGQSRGYNNRQSSPQPAGTAISGSDLFIKVSANKSRVVEQEPVLLTYKVYTLVDLTQLEGKMPDLKGFHTQEIPLPQQKSFKVETINGRSYRTVTWSQYVMFPQVTGKLQVPSITFNGVVVQRNRNIDPFEAFFNGGSGYVEVKKKIIAPAITLQVDPLPTKPSDFSLGVGKMNISSLIDKQTVKAGDPVKVSVVVSGSGNLKLLRQPDINVPKDFDKYDAKITDKTKLTTQGVEGKIIYDFLIVPRHAGKYEVPPITFTYYDTDQRSYRTLTTEAHRLEVTPGSGRQIVQREEVEEIGKDIRFIHTGKVTFDHDDSPFFLSAAYLWGLALQVLLFLIALVVINSYLKHHADVIGSRGKRANKVATRKLRQAARMMNRGAVDEFYDEVLRALWGYVGDRYNISASELTPDKLSTTFEKHQVKTESAQSFLAAIEECEFERYAPGDAKGNMQKTYDAALSAITLIEEDMKKKKTKMPTSCVIVLLTMSLSLFSSLEVSAATQLTDTQLKMQADDAYTRQQYQKSITLYRQLLERGSDADVYYNLGNAYYRTDSITRAIICYEHALLLRPGNSDIRYNLQMARERTIDKITPLNEMFFITWYRSLVNLFNADTWAIIVQVSLALALLLLLLWRLSPIVVWRKIGFFSALFFFVIALCSHLFAAEQNRRVRSHSGAVIVSTVVSVKSTPSQHGTELFLLHEGTKVDITDDSMKEWKAVRVADGKEGWLSTKSIERIN